MADPGPPYHDRGRGRGRRELAGQQDLRDLPQGRVGHRGRVVRAAAAARLTVSVLGRHHPLRRIATTRRAGRAGRGKWSPASGPLSYNSDRKVTSVTSKYGPWGV